MSDSSSQMSWRIQPCLRKECRFHPSASEWGYYEQHTIYYNTYLCEKGTLYIRNKTRTFDQPCEPPRIDSIFYYDIATTGQIDSYLEQGYLYSESEVKELKDSLFSKFSSSFSFLFPSSFIQLHLFSFLLF
jgi:hypothetical protein